MTGRMRLSVLLVTAAVVIVLVVANRQAQRFWFSAAPAGIEPVTVTVAEGDTLSSITPMLADSGLVNAFWFRVYVKFSGGGNDIRPGTYVIGPGSAYAGILGLLHYGNVSDHAVTFPEGFTIAQMGERVIASIPSITADEWKVATGQFSPLEAHPFVVAAQKPDDVDLEGYLFPDTYRFGSDATAEDVVETMIDTMREKYEAAMTDPARMFSSYRPYLDEPTVHEFLTLASIVEKEVRTPQTMAMVADIFYKRLSIGMALQSDATVNYVTGGDDPSISLEDTDLDTPYNTYKYPGLPPGPISNPGANALAAVASPTANDYLYFLTSDEGEIYYATTHDEHVANKARYLR